MPRPGLANYVDRSGQHFSNQQIDPSRALQAQNARVRPNSNLKIRRGQDGSSVQHQQHPVDLNRQSILLEEAGAGGAKRNTFTATEFEGSTVASLNQGQSGSMPKQANQGQYFQQPPSSQQNQANEGFFEDGSGDEESGEEETSDVEGEGEEQELGADEELEAQHGEHVLDRYQQGDSYPPTTNGGPEEDVTLNQGRHTPAVAIHAPTPRTSQKHAALSEQHLPVDDYQYTQQAARNSHQFNQGYQQVQNVMQPAFPAQRNLPTRSQTPPTPKTTAHIGLGIQNARLSRQHSDRPGSSRQARQSTGGQMQPRGYHQPMAQASPAETTKNYEQEQLDYDVKTLQSMEYEALHTEAFDVDPTKPTQSNPTADIKPLAERLASAQNLRSAAEKREFLAGLSLDEWEEAGDWFLERFGEIVQKTREARKERRKLTKVLEEDVYKRHEYVASRKRVIEEALAEMGQSGKVVLRAGTPKKIKR